MVQVTIVAAVFTGSPTCPHNMVVQIQWHKTVCVEEAGCLFGPFPLLGSHSPSGPPQGNHWDVSAHGTHWDMSPGPVHTGEGEPGSTLEGRTSKELVLRPCRRHNTLGRLPSTVSKLSYMYILQVTGADTRSYESPQNTGWALPAPLLFSTNPAYAGAASSCESKVTTVTARGGRSSLFSDWHCWEDEGILWNESSDVSLSLSSSISLLFNMRRWSEL